MKFSDDLGHALNSAQIRSRLSQVELYLDDGDNVFDAGDTLLVADSLLDVTPAALSGGVLTLPLSDGDVVVPPGGVARLFVVGEVPANLQMAQSFQVTLQQKPLPRPQAQDDASGSVLSLECPMNAQSALVTVDEAPKPPVIEPAFFYILFGAQTGDVVGQVVASDPDNDIPATGAYAITAGNAAGALAIQDDGTLVVADASALVDGLLTITVEVTDATGLSASRDFDISVGERIFADGFEAD